MAKKGKEHPHDKIIRELEDCFEKLQEFGMKLNDINAEKQIDAESAFAECLDNIRDIDM